MYFLQWGDVFVLQWCVWLFAVIFTKVDLCSLFLSPFILPYPTPRKTNDCIKQVMQCKPLPTCTHAMVLKRTKLHFLHGFKTGVLYYKEHTTSFRPAAWPWHWPCDKIKSTTSILIIYILFYVYIISTFFMKTCFCCYIFPILYFQFTYWFDSLKSKNKSLLYNPLLSIPKSGIIPKGPKSK